MSKLLNLPPLPTIKEIIQLYNLKARQELSQNFILDLNLTTRIAKVAGDLRESTVIEVGAGPGSLTRSLLSLGAKRVIAVEKDARFLPALEVLKEASQGRLTIVHADMLEVDERQLLRDIAAEPWESEVERVKIVGNLPFNVATEMLLKWLRQVPERSGSFVCGRTSLTLLFQREVALRLVAAPGSKEYGRLSVMSQQRCDVQKRFDIVGKAFAPPPDVTASVVKLKPLVKAKYEVESEPLEYVLRQVFGMRRKHLRNSVRTLCEPKKPLKEDKRKERDDYDSEDEHLLPPIEHVPSKQEQQEEVLRLVEMAGLKENVQPDHLSVVEWCRLASCFRDWVKQLPPQSPAALAYSQFLDNITKKRTRYDSDFFKG